jgi:DNA processing protein
VRPHPPIYRLGLKELPEALKLIPKPPRYLYYQGSLEALNNPCLAVIGTRKLTPYGQAVTRQLTESVAARGITIVSGLAYGADACAHNAAIMCGGQTVAVLAGGLDRWHPADHYYLAQKILDNGGAIISEYLVGVPPRKHSFIARNRLISGLSQAVLITEAGAKSGTLHTANFALEQGRDVLAVPGNINMEGSIGTNNLIKTGATPVTGAQDLLDYFELGQQPVLITANNREEELVLKVLSEEGMCSTQRMLDATGLEVSVFNQTLTMLEITRRIKAIGGGQWSL